MARLDILQDIPITIRRLENLRVGEKVSWPTLHTFGQPVKVRHSPMTFAFRKGDKVYIIVERRVERINTIRRT